MKNYFLKTVAIVTVAIMLISNVSVFAYGNYANNGKNDKANARNDIKEYVRVGTITEIAQSVITLGEKSSKSMFKLSSTTTILNGDDVKVKDTDLKIGMNVEITYKKVSADKKDKVNDAISVKIVKDTTTLKNGLIETISDYSSTEKVVTIMYETIYEKNKIMENEFDLIIDSKTKIYNQFGDSIKASALRAGMIINVEHSNKVTKSYIPQAYAIRIDVVKDEENTQITEDKIIDLYSYDNDLYILVGKSNDVTNQLLFVLSDNIAIKNQAGRSISFDDLKLGQKIRVEHSSVMTRSLPPQCLAYSIQVLDDINKVYIDGAIIEDISLKDKYVTVGYEVRVGARIYEYSIILVVDSKTTILDSNGKTILLSNLKTGMTINVEHEYLAALSSPPKSYAYKIKIVKENTTPSVDSQNCEIYKMLIKLFVETDSKEWLNCIKNHKHDWDYLDCDDMDDFFEDIFESMFDDNMDEDDIEQLLRQIFKGYRYDD